MDDKNLQERIKGISRLIGNTPLLAINCTYKGKERTVYAKAEFLNLTGSIKDRMAFHILNKAYSEGILKAGDRIVEATSGNTGIAFSGVGRALGHPVTIFMPNWMSQERKNLIKSFGANIVLVSPEEGGFLGSIDMANKLAQTEENCYLPRQFSNTDNCQAHYNTTAQELCNQLQTLELKPDAFVAGVGTGGTVMGVGRYLHQQNPNVKIYPLEPSNSPTMSTGHKVGKHRIQGISDEFIPAIVDLSKLDDIVAVDDGDAIIMAQKLSKGLGLGVGISSGANFLGALKVQDMLGAEAIVATVFADDNKKYLSTDLMNEEPVKKDFISTDVKLNYYSCIQRCCILHDNYVSNLGV
ncbi:MAG: PLP-dependent cysteine synthase family protein [Bacteroidales bacterium]